MDGGAKIRSGRKGYIGRFHNKRRQKRPHRLRPALPMGEEISRKRHGWLRMSKEGKAPKRRGLDRDHAQKESQTDPDRARRAQAAQREKQIFRGGESVPKKLRALELEKTA